jgi:hypothetical protein
VIAGILWQGLGDWSGLGASAPFYYGSIMAIIAVFLFYFQGKKTPHKPMV